MLCYANFYLSANSFFSIFQATRGYVYRDTLKMSLGTLSAILAIVKALDIATGAIIGRLSDRTTSRWGRRKPYIAVAFPFGMLCFLLMPVSGFLFQRAWLALSLTLSLSLSLSLSLALALTLSRCAREPTTRA